MIGDSSEPDRASVTDGIFLIGGLPIPEIFLIPQFSSLLANFTMTTDTRKIGYLAVKPEYTSFKVNPSSTVDISFLLTLSKTMIPSMTATRTKNGNADRIQTANTPMFVNPLCSVHPTQRASHAHLAKSKSLNLHI